MEGEAASSVPAVRGEVTVFYSYPYSRDRKLIIGIGVDILGFLGYTVICPGGKH